MQWQGVFVDGIILQNNSLEQVLVQDTFSQIKETIILLYIQILKVISKRPIIKTKD